MRVGDARGWGVLAAGNGVTCGHREGSLWCWGQNDRGQNGRGDFDVHLMPGPVSLPVDAVAADSGFGHVCAVTAEGALLCWGDNQENELSLQEGAGAVNRENPTAPLGPVAAWKDVATGLGHTMAIAADGSLWGWGGNTENELGLGTTSMPGQVQELTRVGTRNDWGQIAIGQTHGCAIAMEGSLWCWGYDGGHGRVGIPGIDAVPEPTQVGTAADWAQVEANAFATCGVRGDSSLWCWGRNGEGQLGLGDLVDRDTPTRIGTDNDWEELVLGRFHSCARKHDDSVWCTGANAAGELGLGDTNRRRDFAAVLLPAP